MHYVVLITVLDGRLDLLREYEQHARNVMRRHGGDFVSIIRPLSPPEQGPHEIHTLRFDTAGGFAAFRSDPHLLRYAPLRAMFLESLEVLEVEPVPLEEYFPAG